MKPAFKKIKKRLHGKCDSLLIASNGDRPDANIRYYAEMDEIASGVFYWNFRGAPFVVVSDIKHKAGVKKKKKETRDTPYNLIKRAGGKTIGFNAECLSVAWLNYLKKKLPGKKFVDVSKELGLVRSVKTPVELKKMRKAAALTKRAFKLAEWDIREGSTELYVFTHLIQFYYSRGAKLAFEPIVASGKNCLYIHANATNKKIKPKDTVIIDTGARLNGYCSDFTKSYCLEPGKKQKELLELVEGANAYARDIAVPGMKAGDLCLAVKDFFGRQAKYWPYGLGHGVGLEVHEQPSLSLGSEDVLEEGMVFTIEPGLAIPKVGGARLEHTGVLTKNGFKVL